MTSELLINRGKLAVVKLTNGEHWLRLAVSLAGEFSGGDLVRFAPEATISVEGTDALSASYTRANWVSGVASGALYAFRTLSIPRQRLIVRELSGRLQASDMEAMADAAAIAVSTLANRELAGFPAGPWTSHVQITDRSPSEATQQEEIIERAH